MRHHSSAAHIAGCTLVPALHETVHALGCSTYTHARLFPDPASRRGLPAQFPCLVLVLGMQAIHICATQA